MNVRKVLIGCLFALAVLAAPALAQDSGGIRPLVTTQREVESWYGPPDETCQCYVLDGRTLRVTYSDGPDHLWGPGTWNVEAGVVLSVEVEYDEGPKLEWLHLDISRLDEAHGGCIPLVIYSDELNGVDYEVDDEERIRSITYGPSAAQRRAYCSSPGDYDPNRPRRITDSGSSPMCTGISAERSEISSGERVVLRANASNPSGEKLDFTWAATGGRIAGSGANVEFDSQGLAPGTYIVTASVGDGYGHVIECSTAIVVR